MDFDFKIVLASSSPRRKDILEKMGLDFKIVEPKVQESSNNIDPRERVICNAKAKALSISDGFPDSVIIGSDTIVYLNGLFFGKPIDPNDARYMLETLSGKKHQVFTGISVLDTASGKLLSGFVETQVYFKELCLDSILGYIASGEPFDKAGAYAIQEGGRDFVVRIDGSLSNVIGLPIELLLELLEEIGQPS